MRSKIWSRRSFLDKGVKSAAALSLLRTLRAQTGSAAILTHEQEEGPYYVDQELLRSDIREGLAGKPLTLRMQFIDVVKGTPLRQAAVDIWHCDASGIYSGYTQASMQMGPPPRGNRSGSDDGPPPPPDGDFGPPPGGDFGPPPGGGGPPSHKPTDQKTFLRGIQITDDVGIVEFSTIFPGCYMGRTNHVHMKVHIGGHASGHYYAGGHVSHTGQVFFPEEISTAVVAAEPYASHRIHRTTLEEDHVFSDQNGSDSMANIKLVSGEKSYLATVTLGVNPDVTPKPVNGFGGPPPRRPQS